MGLINISETQLAFGYLHSFLNVRRPRGFMLPSIRQEGGRIRFPYPGADIIVNNNHLIQFKRPFFFTTNGIKEFMTYTKPVDIAPPYYRFYIKNDNPTNQLNNLILATRRGLRAEYISPIFFEEAIFFRLIRNDLAHLRHYAHIDISQFDGMQRTIGTNNDHTLIYNNRSVNNGFCYCYSEPIKIKAELFNSDTNSHNSEETFKGSEIVKILNSIFFSEESNSISSDSTLYQCIILQRRLLIERNIIWIFNYRK